MRIERSARSRSSALLRRAFSRDHFYNPVVPDVYRELRATSQAKLREYLRLVADLVGWKPAQWARAARIAPSTLNRFLNQDVGHTLSATTLQKLVAAVRTHAQTEGLKPSAELQRMIENVRQAALGDAGPVALPPTVGGTMTADEAELISLYRQLGQGGKVSLMDRAKVLLLDQRDARPTSGRRPA